MLETSSELIVVIRTVDERTLEVCKALVLQQVPEQALYIVSEQPFELTLRRCYEIGINSGAEWMMTLDADVLLRDNAISDFLAEAKKLPPDYFQIEGLIYDKLLNRLRKAGHRIYRVQYLSKALEHIPKDRSQVRPESTTLKKMSALGFPSLVVQKVFGIHDYEQYYSDIYRKSFVHANKHAKKAAEMIPDWQEKARRDPDYLVVLRGFYDGLITSKETCIDARDYLAASNKAISELNLVEKQPFSPDEQNLNLVDALLSQVDFAKFNSTPELAEMTNREKMRSLWTKLGCLLLPYAFGAILSRAGNRLKVMAMAHAKGI